MSDILYCVSTLRQRKIVKEQPMNLEKLMRHTMGRPMKGEDWISPQKSDIPVYKLTDPKPLSFWNRLLHTFLWEEEPMSKETDDFRRGWSDGFQFFSSLILPCAFVGICLGVIIFFWCTPKSIANRIETKGRPPRSSFSFSVGTRLL